MNGAVVVDSHHHVWTDPTEHLYPWMSGSYSPIRRTFSTDELRPALEHAGVDYTVLVQTRSSLQETREFLSLAARTDFIAGVVGWVDLTHPAADEILEELRAGWGGEYLVGIRHQVHDEPDPAWLLREDVQRGIRAVGEVGLVYDLLVRPRELEAAHTLVQRFPSMCFIVDHIAKPEIRAGIVRDWARGMTALSECPNVYCKLSGMVTEADWSTWTVDDIRPYADRVMEWFGPERVMFGSDWPVCLLAAEYAEVVTLCRSLVEHLPESAREAVFGGNATSVYGLSIPYGASR